jgi:hypothetical protein
VKQKLASRTVEYGAAGKQSIARAVSSYPPLPGFRQQGGVALCKYLQREDFGCRWKLRHGDALAERRPV